MGATRALWLVATVLVATVMGDGKKLLYLGGGNLLEYQSPSGAFTVWPFELDAIGMCNPVTSMPLITGTIDEAEKMVFIGGRQLLHVDAATDTFEVMGCQVQTGDEKKLDCTTSLNGTLNLFEGGLKNSLAAAKEKLMEFDETTGAFRVYQMEMGGGDIESLPSDCSVSNSCGLQAPVVATGSLKKFCENVTVGSSSNNFMATGVGTDQFVVQCKDSTGFIVVGMVPIAFQEYNLDVTFAGTFDGPGQLLSLPDEHFMRYDAPNMAWSVYTCEHEHCRKENKGTGSFFKEPECSHTSINKCVNDTRCGYCVDTAKCVAATPAGICFGTCQKFVTKFVNTAAESESESSDRPQTVYLGDNMVLHFLSAKGSYEIMEIVYNHPSFDGKCPYMGQNPVYDGVLPFKGFLVSYYAERQVMFRNPKNGFYAIWKCEPMSRHNPLQSAPCETITEGKLPFAMNPNSVLTFGDYTMGINEHNGYVQTYKMRDPSVSATDEGYFEDAPRFNQSIDALKHRRVAMLGSSTFIDWNNFGEYKLWSWDSNRGVIMGPQNVGQFANMVYDVAWLGEDKLLLTDPDKGDYMALRFERDVAKFYDSPLGFQTIGRGNFDGGVCKFNTCAECAKDVRCGWCASQHKCMPGNDARPCSDGASFKGCMIWTKGYCASDSCSKQYSREDCVKHDACGWCAKAQTCLTQTNGVADNGNCMGNLYWSGMPNARQTLAAQ